jgi:hypothetical protein
MNNPKLTNALLIALIAINSLFLLTWGMKSMHQQNSDRYAMRSQYYGRHHDGFRSFHHCFGASRNYHKGNYGGFRNHNNSRWNQFSNAN